ncbi:glycosyltransferase family 4 protein [Cellulophaga tyrosinoxydans]|uniref:Glycosyltransferase involved in cell wall bisynthesis n=1 Tax=Cellulophaga tyrosinoxydans TaxID=504486 RepID=A0A1W2AQ62_9FLAO|nr:glycosyltransferase [Cellulophaga tyrosinoxydans]SMC62847.1 Glycosyltransferase involved in cell wall bisynthesis [Cellulophaga tyrosinoxydans]
MKKILFILHLPPPVHGAAMVGGFIRDSKIINSTFTTKFIDLGTSASIQEIGKNGVKKWMRFLKIFKETITSLLVFRPKLVYMTLNSHGNGFYKDCLVVLILKIFRTNIIYHFHNKGVADYQDKWFDHLLYLLVLKNEKVILTSPYLYYDIKKYVKEKNVYYCPNGIPIIDDSPSLIKKDNDKVRLLFLSNLLKFKGLFVLVDACKILKTRKVVFQSVVVGGEGDISKEEFENIIKQNNISDVLFYVGRKYNEEKAAEFKNADIFVHPTLDDCAPIVLLEAMQFSLPMVSTFEGGIPDIIQEGKSGFLVQKNDATSLADKIEILINDELLREEMGAYANKRYATHHTLAVFEENLVSILKAPFN